MQYKYLYCSLNIVGINVNCSTQIIKTKEISYKWSKCAGVCVYWINLHLKCILSFVFAGTHPNRPIKCFLFSTNNNQHQNYPSESDSRKCDNSCTSVQRKQTGCTANSGTRISKNCHFAKRECLKNRFAMMKIPLTRGKIIIFSWWRGRCRLGCRYEPPPDVMETL